MTQLSYAVDQPILFQITKLVSLFHYQNPDKFNDQLLLPTTVSPKYYKIYNPWRFSHALQTISCDVLLLITIHPGNCSNLRSGKSLFLVINPTNQPTGGSRTEMRLMTYGRKNENYAPRIIVSPSDIKWISTPELNKHLHQTTINRGDYPLSRIECFLILLSTSVIYPINYLLLLLLHKQSNNRFQYFKHEFRCYCYYFSCFYFS